MNENQNPKRTKEIKIRLTPDEFISLQERKTKPRLAEWLRELALDQKPRQKPKQTDPKLLFELNRIGVNLNQIAKYCNSYKSNIDLITVALKLRSIDEKLKEVNQKK